MNEIKNILLLHQDVKEAEVLPRPDDIRGTALTALVKLKDKEPSLLLQEELRDYVEKEIGTFAKPDEVKFI
jgi:acetyl-CoA synthetase